MTILLALAGTFVDLFLVQNNFTLKGIDKDETKMDDFDGYFNWNSIAFAIFQVMTLTLTGFILAREKSANIFFTGKMLEMQILFLPQPAWLLLKPAGDFSIIFKKF